MGEKVDKEIDKIGTDANKRIKKQFKITEEKEKQLIQITFQMDSLKEVVERKNDEIRKLKKYNVELNLKIDNLNKVQNRVPSLEELIIKRQNDENVQKPVETDAEK